MSEEKAITLRGQELTTLPEPTAREVITIATEWARELMRIVEQQKMFLIITDKKYLYVEAWQTIGAFSGACAVTDWVHPMVDGDNCIGYEAKVDLIKRGEVISSAIMSCGFDEFPCRGKEGSAKHKAAKSAAQTWAESKAYRMKFGYVAKLAGYEPTPAEEMLIEERKAMQGDICPIHDVPFEKKTNKKGSTWWSHKTDSGWCNKTDIDKLPKPEPAPESVVDETQPESAPVSKVEYNRFANEAIGFFRQLDWKEATISTWLRNNFPPCTSLTDLKPDQWQLCLHKLADMVAMK